MIQYRYNMNIIQIIKLLADPSNITQMQQRQYSKSQQKLQKMQSSMIAFRQLIESLRVKNMRQYKYKQIQSQPQNHTHQSQINPQIQSSTNSRLYASEKIIEMQINIDRNRNKYIQKQIQKQKDMERNVQSASTNVVNEDEGLKLKVRGHVAGRDVINKRQAIVHPSKFNQTVTNIKEHARNKNVIQTPSSFADELEPGAHPAVQQIKHLLGKQTSATDQPNNNSNLKQSMLHKSLAQTTNGMLYLNKTSTTMPLATPAKFQQNRFNLKAIALRNKIKDIDQNVIIKYCKQVEQLHQNSKANQIFDFFQGLTTQANVAVISPFIKKFKNCVYFGASISEDDTYEGFLYFYEHRIYFGQFSRNQKHGKGVQVHLDEETIYKGIFKQGQKTGKFWVKKLDQLYIGMLERGLYHGQGKLQTKQSVYQGQFQNGQKHGFGQQSFKKTGVKLTGYFDKGAFSKRSKSSFSHSQLEKGVKFRNNKPNFQNRVIPNSVRTSRNNLSSKNQQQQIGIRFQEQINNTHFPNNNNFQPRRTLFNKQKINSFLPGMGQKLIEPMPENCKDFDYSFDVSSKRDSQFSHFGSHIAKNRTQQKFKKQAYLRIPQISQIQQQQYQNHLDTSALQQPLPVPCFYKK